jgi:hypothetical protein
MEKRLKMEKDSDTWILVFNVTDCGPGNVGNVIDEIEKLGGSVNQIGNSRIAGSISGDSKELTKKVKELMKSGWST